MRRLVRFLTGFFGKITLRYQRVFFATTDTFSASEIRGDSWGPDQDEYLIAILEEPRVARGRERSSGKTGRCAMPCGPRRCPNA